MQNSDIDREDCFLKHVGSSKLLQYEPPVPGRNPYMLDIINEIGFFFAITRGQYYREGLEKLDRNQDINYPYSKFGNMGDAMMVRVSECRYWIATVFESRICVAQTKTMIEYREREVEFNLDEGKYTYLEWSPLSYVSLEKPSLLTLDDKGRLRIHYIKEKTEQVIRKGEIFRCATFSLGGKFIFAINDQQELCKIDLQDFQIVMKRKIKGLDDPVKVFSSHIQQVTHWIFAIGSVIKDEPCLHLVYGDISDHEEELRIKAFEMPLLEACESVMFRTLYVKERELLLFGHTGSNKVRVLQFGLDGSETEIEGISIGLRTLRGMAFMKENRPDELKTNEYQNKDLELSKGPRILILDSSDEIQNFRLFDPNCYAPTVSLFRSPLTIVWFAAKRDQLKARLSRTRKIRYKSLHHQKVEIIDQKKKRSKSQAKISSEEKPKKNRLFAGDSPLRLSKSKENPMKKMEEEKPLRTTTTTNSLFSSTNNLFSSANNLFSTKVEDKPTTTTNGPFSSTNNLFSTTNDLFSKKSEDKLATTNGLFSSINNPFPSTNGLFASKTADNKAITTTNGLFSTNNLSTYKGHTAYWESFGKPSPSVDLSIKEESITPEIVPDDPPKKNAMFFLNKLESDVTFKVEDQEFPAHKSILSEKCRFFKNMFLSGMSESYAPVIEIYDTKASIFKGFLEYVYLDKAILDEEIAIGLIEFSEKYMIDELKSHCEDHLASILTLENCVKLFETACYYEADQLKRKTLCFFQANLKQITQRKDFEDLPKETYIHIKRIQWNHKMIFDPSLVEFMKACKDFKKDFIKERKDIFARYRYY